METELRDQPLPARGSSRNLQRRTIKVEDKRRGRLPSAGGKQVQLNLKLSETGRDEFLVLCADAIEREQVATRGQFVERLIALHREADPGARLVSSDPEIPREERAANRTERVTVYMQPTLIEAIDQRRKGNGISMSGVVEDFAMRAAADVQTRKRVEALEKVVEDQDKLITKLENRLKEAGSA